MNNEPNLIVKVMSYIVDTLARSLVTLFDGVKHAVDHANPSLFALVATLLPFLLPLPVAFMTANSAQHFFGWEPWSANVLGFGLEGLGLLVWVKLVDGIIANVTNQNEKIENFVNFLWAVAIAYEALLVLINVVLSLNEGASGTYAITLLLVCFLPALSAAMYGLHKREVMSQLERERLENKSEAERLRQERREDRKAAAAMKVQYAKDIPRVDLEKSDGDRFRKVKP
jgi:ABC-type multidrug transport system fused ATPase/permease subunit